MTNVFVANSVKDTITVNINNSMDTHKLTERSTSPADGPATAVNCTAVQVPAGRDRGDNQFGTGGGSQNENTVTVRFKNLLSNPIDYKVTTDDLSGHDLYIYVFVDAMVGQDETGRSVGFHAETEEQREKKRHVHAALEAGDADAALEVLRHG